MDTFCYDMQYHSLCVFLQRRMSFAFDSAGSAQFPAHKMYLVMAMVNERD